LSADGALLPHSPLEEEEKLTLSKKFCFESGKRDAINNELFSDICKY